MNNIKNRLIEKHDIENIINRFMGDTPITINNINQFQKAFMHRSFRITDNDNSDDDNFCAMNIDKHLVVDNERLEFFGDKIIDVLVMEYLYDAYPTADPGFMTRLKSRLVRKPMLAMLADKLGFRDFILISSHVERIQGRKNPRLLEDLFESFMGIFYKDQGSDFNICRKFLLNVYAEFVNIEELIANNDNFKDSLLRFFHSRKWDNPVYKTLYRNGDVYKGEFITVLLLNSEKFDLEITNGLKVRQKKILSYIGNENAEEYEKLNQSLQEGNILLGMGKGKTKKDAEQMCSEDCLNNLGISLNY